MSDTYYYLETITNDGHELTHWFCDFLSAIKLCEQINLKKAKSIVLSQRAYNGYEWNKCRETEDVDMLKILIDK